MALDTRGYLTAQQRYSRGYEQILRIARLTAHRRFFCFYFWPKRGPYNLRFLPCGFAEFVGSGFCCSFGFAFSEIEKTWRERNQEGCQRCNFHLCGKYDDISIALFAFGSVLERYKSY